MSSSTSPSTHLRYGLAGLLTFCVVLRVAAWLLVPAIPLLVILFVMVILYSWIFRH